MAEREEGAAQASILVVDDTPENIDVLRGVLKGHYTVRVAINGEQALKRCLVDRPPDLVLLDVMMPGMDGFEVCRRLKADARTAGIPVIFVTAMNEVQDQVQGFEAGGVDYINKPVTPAIVLARVRTHLQLRATYRFIRDTFGRYLSDEVVDRLISSPEGLQLGGEKRYVTVMMADLRGFTSIGERLPPETVVSMINIFLGRMTEVIQQHRGTIDEFIGDAILTIFGAPVWRDDDAIRAVRCAVDMQLAMQDVNREFAALGYPQVEMGIGINSGEAIVGNIGSSKRAKYGVVGRVVNTASRIESYTIGGQILIADSTRSDCGDQLRIDAQMQVLPKGLNEPITVFEVGGIVGDAELPRLDSDAPVHLERALPVQLMMLSGKHVSELFSGELIAAGHAALELRADQPCPDFSNLRVIFGDSGRADNTLYAKVIGQLEGDSNRFRAHITSMPPETAALLGSLRKGEGQAPLRLLHLTDFHLFTHPQGQIKGVRTGESLGLVLEHAHDYLPDPDLIILGGDLAQDEQSATYEKVAMMVDRWRAPFMVTPGNHASMPMLNQTLIPALGAISSCVEHLLLPGWQVIGLNSHAAGSIAGFLPDQELERLEQQLSDCSDRFALIALHHHPVDVGSRWMDRIGLKNRDALWRIIDRNPQVRAVLCGHIHQDFDCMRGSVRVLGTPSTCVQFAPRHDAFRLDAASPGYRWLELFADGSVRTGIERITGFIPPDLENDDPY